MKRIIVAAIVSVLAFGALFAFIEILDRTKTVIVTHLLYSARHRVEAWYALEAIGHPSMEAIKSSTSDALARDIWMIRTMQVPVADLPGGALEDLCNLVQVRTTDAIQGGTDDLFSQLATDHLADIRAETLNEVRRSQRAFGLGGTGCRLTAEKVG